MTNKIHSLFLILFVNLTAIAQPTSKESNIQGLWQSTKAGAELFIEIKGTEALITSVGKTKLTKNIEGGSMYKNIRSIGQNSWQARRNAWKYLGVGGANSENGRWEAAEELILKLSSDGNSLTASGHWTYKRVNPTIKTSSTNTAAAKQTITEDFGGVVATLNLINKENGDSFILAQFANKTITFIAQLDIKAADGTVYTEVLNPGSILTKKYDTPTMEVQVSYTKTSNTRDNRSIIEHAKQIVKKSITNEGGKIIVTPMGFTGVRG